MSRYSCPDVLLVPVTPRSYPLSPEDYSHALDFTAQMSESTVQPGKSCLKPSRPLDSNPSSSFAQKQPKKASPLAHRLRTQSILPVDPVDALGEPPTLARASGLGHRDSVRVRKSTASKGKRPVPRPPRSGGEVPPPEPTARGSPLTSPPPTDAFDALFRRPQFPAGAQIGLARGAEPVWPEPGSLLSKKPPRPLANSEVPSHSPLTHALPGDDGDEKPAPVPQVAETLNEAHAITAAASSHDATLRAGLAAQSRRQAGPRFPTPAGQLSPVAAGPPSALVSKPPVPAPLPQSFEPLSPVSRAPRLALRPGDGLFPDDGGKRGSLRSRLSWAQESALSLTSAAAAAREGEVEDLVDILAPAKRALHES